MSFFIRFLSRDALVEIVLHIPHSSKHACSPNMKGNSSGGTMTPREGSGSGEWVNNAPPPWNDFSFAGRRPLVFGRDCFVYVVDIFNVELKPCPSHPFNPPEPPPLSTRVPLTAAPSKQILSRSAYSVNAMCRLCDRVLANKKAELQ